MYIYCKVDLYSWLSRVYCTYTGYTVYTPGILYICQVYSTYEGLTSVHRHIRWLIFKYDQHCAQNCRCIFSLFIKQSNIKFSQIKVLHKMYLLLLLYYVFLTLVQDRQHPQLITMCIILWIKVLWISHPCSLLVVQSHTINSQLTGSVQLLYGNTKLKNATQAENWGKTGAPLYSITMWILQTLCRTIWRRPALLDQSHLLFGSDSGPSLTSGKKWVF